jgi:hypothetical protein
MSVISAPPRKEVYVLYGQYGAVSGAVTHPRARLWLLTNDAADDPDAVIFARIAYNHPQSGAVVYQDLGEIAQGKLRGNGGAEVHLVDGRPVSMVPAPCVCGAGAVGSAMPEAGRISLNYVNPYGRSRLLFT